MQNQINTLNQNNLELQARIRELEGSAGEDVQVLRQKNAQLTQEVLRLQKSESDLTKKLTDIQSKNTSSPKAPSSGNLIGDIINFFKNTQK